MDSAGPAILLKLLPAIRSILEGLQQNAHLVEAGKQPDADITKLVTTFVDIMARCRAYVNSLDDSDSRSEQPFAQTQAELHQLIDEKSAVLSKYSGNKDLVEFALSALKQKSGEMIVDGQKE